MALIALLISAAFAVTFPTKSTPTWCAKPHELTFIQYASPGWWFDKKVPKPSSLSATHIRAYDDGEHCLVFSDLSDYMSINSIDVDNDVIGIMVEVDHYAAFVECAPAADTNRCDWQVDTKKAFAPTKLFPFPSDILVISGLRETSVVIITLMRMHLESTAATCSGGSTRNGKRQFECTASYSGMVLDTRMLSGTGSANWREYAPLPSP